MFIKPKIKGVVYKHDGVILKQAGEEVGEEHVVFYNRLKVGGVVDIIDRSTKHKPETKKE